DDAAVRRAAELELGVGDDDALVTGDPFAEIIDRARRALELFGDVVAQNLAHPRDRDVFIMTGLGLGGRAEDRRVELFAFGETILELLAGERAGCGILLPGRAGDIAADYAFHREDGGAPAQHRAA